MLRQIINGKFINSKIDIPRNSNVFINNCVIDGSWFDESEHFDMIRMRRGRLVIANSTLIGGRGVTNRILRCADNDGELDLKLSNVTFASCHDAPGDSKIDSDALVCQGQFKNTHIELDDVRFFDCDKRFIKLQFCKNIHMNNVLAVMRNCRVGISLHDCDNVIMTNSRVVGHFHEAAVVFAGTNNADFKDNHFIARKADTDIFEIKSDADSLNLSGNTYAGPIRAVYRNVGNKYTVTNSEFDPTPTPIPES